MNKEELLELEKILLKHCYDMNILRTNAPIKKKEAILDSLIVSVVRTYMSLDEIKDCITDVNQNKVINMAFFDKGGNLFEDFINPKWVDLAKALFRQRSVGLGTPNAASGEGELMFLFLSKEIKKPTRGDLLINDEVVELKGDIVRVMGEVRGKEFREKTLKVCKKYNLNPNKANRTNLDAVEIEKFQHLSYWKKELSKLPLDEQKNFVNDWLFCLDNQTHNNSVNKIFLDNSFNQKELIKEIVKILYSVMVNTRDFKKFVILGDGSNSKILSNDINSFNAKVDQGLIIPDADYFRINQYNNIGWYIS